MITCNLDRLVFAFKQRSSDRSAAHRWNKKEMKRAMLRTKWNECREWDLMIFFLLHEKKSFQCCPYDRHGTTKEMTTTLIIRWECVYLSLSNLFHDKWLFLIDLALCLIITRCTIENFPPLLILLWELFFLLRSALLKNSFCNVSITAWRLIFFINFIFRNNLVTQLLSLWMRIKSTILSLDMHHRRI